MSYRYAGFTWGYDRYLGSNNSLGLQAFGNQYKADTALSLNYFFSPHESSGWIIGLDLYRAYETEEFTFEFIKDVFLNPENIDIDAELGNGVSVSVGYQF